MNRLKNHLIAAAVLSVLAVIGSIMNLHQAAAQGPPNGLAVNIVNPVPVPVTGSLGISGTASVSVTNPATAPVSVLDISRTASQHVTLFCGSTYCFAPVTPGVSTPYVVPAGQSLVVTAIEITTLNSGLPAVLMITKSPDNHIWRSPADGFTHSFQYPSGTVFPSGFTFDSSAVSAPAPVQLVRLEGFLTAN